MNNKVKIMHRFFISQIIIVILLTGCNSQSSLIIDDLSCENLTNPVGIGTSTPGLSWKIKSEKNGTSQKAYQILVASDTSLLNESNADLWNSGKTESSSSVSVPSFACPDHNVVPALNEI